MWPSRGYRCASRCAGRYQVEPGVGGAFDLGLNDTELALGASFLAKPSSASAGLVLMLTGR